MFRLKRAKSKFSIFCSQGFGLKERAHINYDGRCIRCWNFSIDDAFAIRYWRLSCSLIIRSLSHHETADLEFLIVLEQVDNEALLQLLSFMAQLFAQA